jgi:acyl-CoA synthetase (NDP forming)
MLDLRHAEEVRHAYNSILAGVAQRYPRAEREGIVIQQMLKDGRELIVGSDFDPIFGPLLKIGNGGPLADIVPDFQYRIAPVTPLEAQEMIESLKIYPLLLGLRGRRPAHIPSLVALLCRASQLIEDFEEIREFEINPLIVFPRRKDFWAVDGKMRLFGPEELKTRGARFE